MGKKDKIGKERKDEYYKLAKQQGYRARAAFKLIEINKKFHFLESSQLILDLCAAPGSWMQVARKVAKKNTPIIGVDLVKIDPIPGCIAIKADITTDRCRTLIKENIKTCKVDVILHDGAPNVGTNWNIDEIQQAILVLKSFQLATEFLVKGGTFVTKVFRSKDYESLRWVFNQLFESVEVVKPKSSRSVSAEIFLVCLKYKAPIKLDPKFTDPKYVFQDVDKEEEKDLTFDKVQKMNKKAVGYESHLISKSVNVTELLLSPKPMNILLTYNNVILDDKDVREHPATNDMIKQFITDLKLLSKHEFKKLKSWLAKVIPFYKKKVRPEPVEVKEKEPEKTEEEQIQEQIEQVEEEIKKAEKKKVKKERQDKMKTIKMIQHNMLHPGDVIPISEEVNVFNSGLVNASNFPVDIPISAINDFITTQNKLKRIDVKNAAVKKTKEQICKTDEYAHNDYGMDVEDANSDSDDDDSEAETEDNALEVDEDDVEVDLDAEVEDDIDEDTGSDIEEDSYIEENESDENSKSDFDPDFDYSEEEEEIEVVENKKEAKKRKADEKLEHRENKRSKTISSWVGQDDFQKLMYDSDSEVDDMLSEEDEDALEDIEDVVQKSKSETINKNIKDETIINERKNLANTINFKLSAKERALAVEMIRSRKRRSEIIDWSYNKHQFEEERNLPSWFVESEKKYMKPVLPFIDENDVKVQKEEISTNINKRTIKKVEQAKARKRFRVMKKLKGLNNRALRLDGDETEIEKNNKIKELNKRVKRVQNKKTKVVTEVMNRSGIRKRAGKYQKNAKVKVVDRRMKSDMRQTDSKKKAANKKR